MHASQMVETKTGEFTEKTLAPRRGIAFVCAVAEADPATRPASGGRSQAATPDAAAANPSRVGPVTALATEVFLGDAHRFARANKVATRFVLLTLALLFSVPICAREKTDVMVMTNGDRLTCEVKGLDAGVLYVSFDYIAGTASVNWSKVARLESNQLFVVKTMAARSTRGY